MDDSCYFVDYMRRHLRIERQRNDLPAEFLDARKASRLIAQMSERRLEMMRNHVVDVALDVSLLQVIDQSVTIATKAQLEHVPIGGDAVG